QRGSQRGLARIRIQLAPAGSRRASSGQVLAADRQLRGTHRHIRIIGETGGREVTFAGCPAVAVAQRILRDDQGFGFAARRIRHFAWLRLTGGAGGGGTESCQGDDNQQAGAQGCREWGGFRHHRATISCSPMKASIRQKLEKTSERFEEVGRLLADPAIAGGSDTFRELSMEYARLEPVAAGLDR